MVQNTGRNWGWSSSPALVKTPCIVVGVPHRWSASRGNRTLLYLDCWEHECIFKDWHGIIMESVYTR